MRAAYLDRSISLWLECTSLLDSITSRPSFDMTRGCCDAAHRPRPWHVSSLLGHSCSRSISQWLSAHRVIAWPSRTILEPRCTISKHEKLSNVCGAGLWLEQLLTSSSKPCLERWGAGPIMTSGPSLSRTLPRLPYTTAMALSEAMQHMPNFSGYLSPVNRYMCSWLPFQLLPCSTCTCGSPHDCGHLFLQAILSLLLLAC